MSRKVERTEGRRVAVDRPTQTGRVQNNWQAARESGEAARVESAMRLRQQLGLSTTDAEIRARARERTEEATRRAIRDAGEG